MNHPSHAPFKNVPRETFSKLETYVALLEKWNAKINLVSRETFSGLWDRHILDCLQLAEHIPPGTEKIIDLGSGAGLPGLILAIALPIHVTLVERDQRKCAFLLEAARILALFNITVRNSDIAAITGTFPLVTARALAPLTNLCALAYPLLGKDAFCLFPKGKNYATELADATTSWSFHYESIPSKTDADAAVLLLSHLERKNFI